MVNFSDSFFFLPPPETLAFCGVFLPTDLFADLAGAFFAGADEAAAVYHKEQ